MASVIRGLREAEIAASVVFRKLLIVRVVLSASPTNLAPMATFVVYTVIALVRHDESILAAKAFTSISLISLVTAPVLTLIQALPAVVQCLGCFDRIQEYCSTQDGHSTIPQERDWDVDKGMTLANILGDNMMPEIQNQSFSWDRSAPSVLIDIALNIPPGAITMLVRPVGSGKTTLLESILGETFAIGSSSKSELPPVAYCSQNSLRNGVGLLFRICQFSQDMDLIDMSLPVEVFNVIAFIYFVQKLYIRTSRQLRFLNIEAKAPLYSHFLSLVKGASTVRAYHWQGSFYRTCVNLFDTSQRPVYFLYCVQQCLSFFLDMLVARLAVVLIATVVSLKQKFDPGDVGVALVMVMTFNSALMQLVKDWTNMETSVGAVARVKAFSKDTPIEEALETCQLLPDNWPAYGSVEISKITASHVGKTSLILSLLGMVEVEEGSITIDRINFQGQSRAQVRERLNVVAQDPFFMAGSVGFNVDPFEKVSAQRISDALNNLGLLRKIQQDGGLGADLNPSSWSQGQSQLLCLGRAMVQEGKVLILDEAMSSVDDETEDIMQDTIDTEFASHTVLAVMYRLRHIERYGRVAVLENWGAS
ncbi:hypothetical protein BDW69DRAFT_187033 [Aspergillus filifer]